MNMVVEKENKIDPLTKIKVPKKGGKNNGLLCH